MYTVQCSVNHNGSKLKYKIQSLIKGREDLVVNYNSINIYTCNILQYVFKIVVSNSVLK